MVWLFWKKKQKERKALIIKNRWRERTKIRAAKGYSNVAYADNEDAKELGARWDADRKKWYAPDDSIKCLIERYK